MLLVQRKGRSSDINKVDTALRNRPSRFKYVKGVNNPGLREREKLLPADWARMSENLNLDQVQLEHTKLSRANKVLAESAGLPDGASLRPASAN